MRSQSDPLGQIGADPLAGDIALGKTDIPARKQAAKGRALAQLNHPMRAWQLSSMVNPAARGQDDCQPSALQMLERTADEPWRDLL